jgi:hypothetical protein
LGRGRRKRTKNATTPRRSKPPTIPAAIAPTVAGATPPELDVIVTVTVDVAVVALAVVNVVYVSLEDSHDTDTSEREKA